MADNDKYIARIPIVLDEFKNKNNHQNHELVVDIDNEDLYIKNGNGYINITGKIREQIKEIQDGSSVIHVVTEQTIPPVKDREENHWYYVITDTEDADGGSMSTTSYIYYGLIKTYDTSKNYLLIAQNTTTGSDVVKMTVAEGYVPCFYIPINYNASFKNNSTSKAITATIEDRVYAMNSAAGSYIAYDVYVLQLYDAGDYNIKIDLTGSNNFSINFDTNEANVPGLKLPATMSVRDGDTIGTIVTPTWTDPRFIFKGWSTSKIAATIIDPTKYKPNGNMTLFAWFEYNTSTTALAYYATCLSSTNKAVEG